MTEPATVAEFQGWARDVIADCRGRGVTPVLVGGSALYTGRSWTGSFPGTDPAVRRQLEDELAEVGPEAMHRRLTAVDADAAAKIEPGNGRRIVRALEVVAITGRPFSASLPELRYHYPDAHQIGVDIPARCSTSGSRCGCSGCGRPASSTRYAASPTAACGRAAPRAAPWATSRCSPSSTARSPRSRPGADGHRHPSLRPAPGQLVPQGPPDHLGRLGRPERVAKALAAVAAAQDAAEV